MKAVMLDHFQTTYCQKNRAVSSFVVVVYERKEKAAKNSSKFKEVLEQLAHALVDEKRKKNSSKNSSNHI